MRVEPGLLLVSKDFCYGLVVNYTQISGLLGRANTSFPDLMVTKIVRINHCIAIIIGTYPLKGPRHRLIMYAAFPCLAFGL